jgi:ATP-dependent Clp protease adaptor protein ClpS
MTSESTITLPDSDQEVKEKREGPWQVIVWDDPINLMSYVTWVFQQIFKFSYEKAERLMYEVHTKGQAVVAQCDRERAEIYVSQLHSYGLWATMERQ